jgi:elongation factor P
MQYLYQDETNYHFLDQNTYDEIILNEHSLEDVKHFLKEQIVYTILYFEDRPIAVTPPLFMELEVTDAPPGVKGDTAQGGATKPATLETGLVLQVPLFVETGTVIKVDTRDSKYIERVDKK